MRVDSSAIVSAVGGSVALAVGLAAGCTDRPTAPSAAIPPIAEPSTEISGRVWWYDGRGPHTRPGVISGFVFAARRAYGTGGYAVAADGSYRLFIPTGAFVYLHAVTSGEFHPCVLRVTAATGAPVTSADVHVVADRARLGANLPPELLRRSPLLSGTVFEALADGGRAPVADAQVELDGAGGDGLVLATTLTDADGRYVLCGLDADREPYFYVSREGYRTFGSVVRVDGNTVFDVELRR